MPFRIAKSDAIQVSPYEMPWKGRVALGHDMTRKMTQEMTNEAFGGPREWLAVANHFRSWVCREISAASPAERENLRGDYLFVIDGEPRFVVFVGADWNGSAQFGPDGLLSDDDSVPLRLDAGAIDNLIATSHRVRISTTTAILQRLLMGTMRARIAYLSGQVQIDGDLPVFLRLVALLKARGVGPTRGAAVTAVDRDVQASSQEGDWS